MPKNKFLNLLKFGILQKINGIHLLSTTAVALSIGLILYNYYSTHIMQTAIEKLNIGIVTVYSILDLEQFDSLDKESYKTLNYWKIQNKLNLIQGKFQLASIQVLKLNQKKEFDTIYDFPFVNDNTTNSKRFFPFKLINKKDIQECSKLEEVYISNEDYKSEFGNFKFACLGVRVQNQLVGMIFAYYEITEINKIQKIGLNFLTTLFLIGILITILTGFLIKSYIVRPLLQLNDATKQITEGNLDYTININRKDEIGELANSFNTMAANLKSSFAIVADQNTLLEKRVKERTIELENAKEEMEALNHFTYLINSISSLNEIFVEISKYMRLKYNIISLWLCISDEKREYAHTYKTYSYIRLPEDQYQYLLNKKIPLNDKGGNIYLTLNRQKPFYIRKIKNFKYELEKEIIEKLGIKSVLLVPLVSKNQSIGLFAFSNMKNEIKLQKKEIETITNICAQISGVIQTTLLLQEVKDSKEQIEELNLLIKSLNEEIELKVIMKKVIDYIQKNFGIKYYGLHKVNKNKTDISLLDYCIPDYADEKDISVIRNSNISISGINGAHKFAFKNKKTIYFNEIKYDSLTEVESFVVEKFKIKSYLMLPLILQNVPIGILDFFDEDKMHLSDDDISRITILGEHLAGIIHASNLFQQVQEEKEKAIAARVEADNSKKETEYLNTFSKLINSVNDLDLIFKYTVENLKLNLDADIYWLQLLTKDKKRLFTRCLSVPDFISDEIVEEYRSKKFKLKEESGSIFMTYSRKKTLYINNLNSISDTKITEIENNLIKAMNTNTTLQIPLLVQNEVFGIMHINQYGGLKRLNKSKLKFIESFCEQLAIAAHNSSLYEDVESEKENADIEKGIAVVAQQEAEIERDKSEKLLQNILPKEVIEELKENGVVRPQLFESVSVLFTDFKGFTSIAEKMTPQELVSELGNCFSFFDSLMIRYRLEKLKTIGDSYMCAGGIPKSNLTHAIDATLVALEIQEFMSVLKNVKTEMGLPFWELRIGIHTGPLIAGVIGENKFAYDVWGDTVNTASRMESSGTVGKINISEVTYELIKDLFDCEYRGKVNAKNKGEVNMYYVVCLKKEYSLDVNGKYPNAEFWKKHSEISESIL